MLAFNTIDIKTYNLDYLVVNWSIKPTTEDIALYTFSIWRSESIAGPFAAVKDGLVDVFSYKDPDIAIYSKWRKFFYKVRCYLTADATKYVETPVEYNGTKPDPTAVEIVARNNLLLKNFSGVDAYVFIRKTWGQRCPNCWDAVKQRKTESNCTVCYNTGFVGGFYPAIKIKANFSPSPEIVRHGNFLEKQIDSTYAWLSNYPPISAKDVIVENGRKRWRVVQPSKTEKLRLPLHQTVQLIQINLNDIEYSLKIPGAE